MPPTSCPTSTGSRRPSAPTTRRTAAASSALDPSVAAPTDPPIPGRSIATARGGGGPALARGGGGPPPPADTRQVDRDRAVLGRGQGHHRLPGPGRLGPAVQEQDGRRVRVAHLRHEQRQRADPQAVGAER